jgi:hypothetical protein
MQGAGIRPNVRTYTALVGALGRGGQWSRAQALLRCALPPPTAVSFCSASGCQCLAVVRRHAPRVLPFTTLKASPVVPACRDMRRGQPWGGGGGTEPNAYTYSALLKAMGEQVGGTRRPWQIASCSACHNLPVLRLSHVSHEGLNWSIIRGAGVLTSAAVSLQGKWQLAESVFEELEAEALGRQPPCGGAPAAQSGRQQQAAELATPPGGNLWTAAELSGALPAGLGSDFSGGGSGSGGAGSTASSPVPIAGATDFNPLEPYGLLPTTLAEQVRHCPAAIRTYTPKHAAGIPACMLGVVADRP